MMTDEYFFICPYCWQNISFILDFSVPHQILIEDCEVCCNPIEAEYKVEENEIVYFDAKSIEQ